jgi:hypothetical protein
MHVDNIIADSVITERSEEFDGKWKFRFFLPYKSRDAEELRDRTRMKYDYSSKNKKLSPPNSPRYNNDGSRAMANKALIKLPSNLTDAMSFKIVDFSRARIRGPGRTLFYTDESRKSYNPQADLRTFGLSLLEDIPVAELDRMRDLYFDTDLNAFDEFMSRLLDIDDLPTDVRKHFFSLLEEDSSSIKTNKYKKTSLLERMVVAFKVREPNVRFGSRAAAYLKENWIEDGGCDEDSDHTCRDDLRLRGRDSLLNAIDSAFFSDFRYLEHIQKHPDYKEENVRIPFPQPNAHYNAIASKLTKW